jgi:two-component system sensor histidine kinase UhpB
VTNAIRHGKAGSVRVEIFEKRRTRAEGKFKAGPALHLAIQDDGHGIGADTPAGFGLTVMRERIQALDGSFIIESAPTRGTTLLIILPIQNRAAEGSKPREGIKVS